jgi:hypothetical protein
VVTIFPRSMSSIADSENWCCRAGSVAQGEATSVRESGS